MPSATDANTNILLNELSKAIKLVKVQNMKEGLALILPWVDMRSRKAAHLYPIMQ